MRGGQWWIRACSTLSVQKMPMWWRHLLPWDKRSFPHCFWLCLHSHHCTISFINQSINQSLHIYQFRMWKENKWKHVFTSWRCLRTCGLKPTNNRNRSLSKHPCFGWQQVRSTLYFPAPYTCLQVWQNVWRSYNKYKANSHFSVFLFQIWVHASQAPWF